MKNLNLYALANELNLGDPRSGTIRIPFGRWDFGEKQLGDGRTVYFEQELSRSGAEQIAAKVNAGVAAGEKGVPVYWGHPDVPELAHKYPDKRAKGWIKSATIGPDFLELRVEWLEDNATDGFGWFSPYWGGPAEHLANGRYLKTVNDLTSVALVNIPNIQDFRLANESQGGEQTKGKAFAMPQHLIDLARRFDERVRLANEANFDESKHPRAADGKFSSGGGGGSSGKSDGKTQGSGKSLKEQADALKGPADQFIRFIAEGGNRKETLEIINGELLSGRWRVKHGGRDEDRVEGLSRRKAAHRLAILSGFKFNRSTGSYE